MWDKLGFITAIIGTVAGGTAFCLLVAAVMYLTILRIVPTVGKGHVAEWDEVFPVSILSGNKVKNAPRVVIRGERIDGGCSYDIGFTSSTTVTSIRALTIWEDHDTCETEMEIRAKPRQPEARH